jgi:hypothetical protein
MTMKISEDVDGRHRALRSGLVRIDPPAGRSQIQSVEEPTYR